MSETLTRSPRSFSSLPIGSNFRFGIIGMETLGAPSESAPIYKKIGPRKWERLPETEGGENKETGRVGWIHTPVFPIGRGITPPPTPFLSGRPNPAAEGLYTNPRSKKWKPRGRTWQEVRDSLPYWSSTNHAETAEVLSCHLASVTAEWDRVFTSAIQAKYGRDPQIGDYRISGIGDDSLSEETKEILRELATIRGEYANAAGIHLKCARYPIRPGARLTYRGRVSVFADLPRFT